MTTAYRDSKASEVKALLHLPCLVQLTDPLILEGFTQLLEEEISKISTAENSEKWSRWKKYLIDNYIKPTARYSPSQWSNNWALKALNGHFDSTNNHLG